MDFSLTEQQQQLRGSVRAFAEGEIAPHVMEWDEVSHFPMEIMTKLGDMGLLGVIFPEQYGGAGLGYLIGNEMQHQEYGYGGYGGYGNYGRYGYGRYGY